MKKNFYIKIILLFVFAFFTQSLFAQSQIGRIIKLDSRVDDSSKIPLIFIHGIHGTADIQDLSDNNGYWNVFRDKFNNDNDLNQKYILYSFQYYSDKVSVLEISKVLGKEIDQLFPNRPPMLVAHSMGGLVAKNYMVYFNTKIGKLAGDFVIGLITLATPHHGSPGANDSDTFDKYYKIGYESALRGGNWWYWNISNNKIAPDKPNRSDLRWNNFDFKIDSKSKDINLDLEKANIFFNKYHNKVIVYAGILKPQKPVFNADTIPIFTKDDHKRAEFADGMMYYGFEGAFGNTDGLVPYKSALFCDSNTAIFPPNQIPPNFICASSFRVNRFEFGNETIVNKKYFPDSKTLNIIQTLRGFDHRDMYEHELVWRILKLDLLNKFNINNITPPKPIPVKMPEIPTLFLLDVSGSMQENNKIEQARESALTALETLKDNQKKGLGNTSVSVWVFSGDACTLQNARQILPFTPNLNLAENSIRSNIPNPSGGTPLPQAVERTTNEMLTYLQNNPNLEEGRIILLSDGQSTCNQLRPADVYSQARTISIKKTTFYTIGFEVPAGSAAERDLQYLASASGGQYFPAQNQQQLARAFQKTIRVYLPKTTADSSASFNTGVQQIIKRNYAEALQYWTIYVRNNPTDALGFYNLAITCEALGRFKTAIENYQKYLQLIGDSADKAEIEAKIITLEQEYRDQFFYYIDLLQSDLNYLKAYYQRLFERKNNELGQEFRGFVNEKKYFYANILDFLEIKSNFLRRDTEDLTASMNVLNNRVGLDSFDRDAVSLLTIPIGQLEDLIEKLERYRNQNFK